MSDINVRSSTQKIIVDPASSSVAVVNAGPIGPAGPPGVGGGGEDGGAGIQSSLPTEYSLGSMPAGAFLWPDQPREIGGYISYTDFYQSGGGALKAGIFGVSIHFTGGISDTTNPFTFELWFGPVNFSHAQSAYLISGGMTMYAEDYLDVGQHIGWRMYKSAGMAAFAATALKVGMSYRPVTDQ